MKELRGRVAVVTGAASGIGRALARRLGAEGMKVVLADVEAEPLERAGRALEAEGVESRVVVTDVSRAEEVAALAERTLGAFGAVHLVCNNAGVFAGGPCWEATPSDWEWVLGVNLWGVIHGIRSFLPILLEQGEEGHVLNTASVAALTSGPLSAVYSVSKHAVLALSESLYFDLKQRNAPIGVSVLCPEAVVTRIAESERNRPARLPRPGGASPERGVVEGMLRQVTAGGVDPDVVAERAVRGIREGRFYLLPGGRWTRLWETRLEDVRLARNPTFPPPFAEEG